MLDGEELNKVYLETDNKKAIDQGLEMLHRDLEFLKQSWKIGFILQRLSQRRDMWFITMMHYIHDVFAPHALYMNATYRDAKTYAITIASHFHPLPKTSIGMSNCIQNFLLYTQV